MMGRCPKAVACSQRSFAERAATISSSDCTCAKRFVLLHIVPPRTFTFMFLLPRVGDQACHGPTWPKQAQFRRSGRRGGRGALSAAVRGVEDRKDCHAVTPAGLKACATYTTQMTSEYVQVQPWYVLPRGTSRAVLILSTTS